MIGGKWFCYLLRVYCMNLYWIVHYCSYYYIYSKLLSGKYDLLFICWGFMVWIYIESFIVVPAISLTSFYRGIWFVMCWGVYGMNLYWIFHYCSYYNFIYNKLLSGKCDLLFVEGLWYEFVSDRSLLCLTLVQVSS